MANHKNGEVSAMNDIKLALLGNKEAAKRLTDAGVLEAIENCADILDKVKIGKLNYYPSTINWAEFGRKAEALCKKLGLDYYIKDSLRKEMEAKP